MTAPIRPRLRLAAGAAISCIALLGLNACSDDAESGTSTESDSPAQESTQESAPIEIVVEGESIQPAGERVEVAVGEPIAITVTSDREGELHVHSTPEQEIEFTEGTSEHEIVIEQPGVVEVESHDPDIVVLQLEAR